jgi:acyl-CoA synthetase (AMP-forming)/AMP-acid ligase II
MTLPNFDQSFTHIINEACRQHAEKECLKFNDESFSYSEVDSLSSKIANQLMAGGFEKGMHGAVYSLNSAIAFIAALGIIRAGGVWIPVNARNSATDNVAILLTLGCDALLFQEDYADSAEEIRQGGQCGSAMVCLDDTKQEE